LFTPEIDAAKLERFWLSSSLAAHQLLEYGLCNAKEKEVPPCAVCEALFPFTPNSQAAKSLPGLYPACSMMLLNK
jgi:hypothetical protein